jgi:hypothetical protein
LTLTYPSVTIRAVRSAAIGRIAIGLILAAWGYPTVASIAVGVHLAAHHHHDEFSAPMALAMAHGHEHDLKVPAHRHDATTPDHETLRIPSASTEFNPASLTLSGAPGGFTPLALDRAHSPPSTATLSPLRL